MQNLRRVLVVIALLIAAPRFWGQRDISAQAVLDPLHLALFNALQRVGAPAQVLVLQQAEPFSPWLNLGDADDFERVRARAQTAVSVNWSTRYVEGPLDSLIATVLREAEWGRTPFNEVEAKQFERLANALFVRAGTGWAAQEAYAVYKVARAEYLAVKREYDSTVPSQRTVDLQRRYRRARDRYNGEAQGPLYAEYERVLTTLWRYDSAKGVKRDAERTAAENLDTHGRPRVLLNPALGPFRAEWAPVELQARLNADIVPPFGYIPADLQPGFSARSGEDVAALPSPSSVRLAFDVAVVSIARPSFDFAAVFESRVWRWNRPPLSDGLVPSRSDEDGTSAPQLRGIPIGLVFVRNVTIRADGWPPELSRALAQSRLRVRLGPLCVAGEFSAGGDTLRIQPVPYGARDILVPTVQLVGVVVQRAPKAPDPRSDLVWDPLPDFPLDQQQ